MSRFLRFHGLALLVGGAGLLLSFGAFWAIHAELVARHQLEFEWLAHNRNRVLKKGIEERLDALHSLHDLFRVSEQVDELAFGLFARGLFDRYRGIHALAWVPRTPSPHEPPQTESPAPGVDGEGKGRPVHEDRAGDMPGAMTSDRFLLGYLEARGDSGLQIGQDLGAQPVLRALMARALASGDMVVSGRIPLIEGDNPQYGFMALMPVLRPLAPDPGTGADRAELRGFVVGVFRIADIADVAMGLLEPRGVEFLVMDDSAPTGEELLDFYASRLNRAPAPASTQWRGWDLASAPRVTETFPVGDRRWSITCSPTHQFTTEGFVEGPWIVLGSGLALTLVMVLFILHFRAALRTRLRIAEELRESEQKLRILFHQSPDIIMTVDREGCVLILNRPLQTLQMDKEVSRCGARFLPIRARGTFNQALARVLAMGEPEGFGYAGDDSTWWELRLVPLREGARVMAAMVILTNVTEKRVLEAHAIRNARLASLGVLAASVAHEINNPNNAIQFNASILTRSWEDIRKILNRHRREYGDFNLGGVPVAKALEGLPRLLEGIVKGSQRIEKIVGNLKHMARPDAGDLNHPVDLGEVLPIALSILQSQIRKYTDHCHLVLPESLPKVRGNSQQLEQVFINLVLNALQSLPNRAAGVRITGGLEPEGEFVRIRVEDEGQGMTDEVRERVMEPFFTTRLATGGTGLGLSICARIVQHHSGRMEIESRPGAGTQVSVWLPVATA
jgi:signal transduction histidine kinase